MDDDRDIEGPTPDEVFDFKLEQAANATARTRFVLVRNDDGTWSFGAPSMLSYSPRPGDMATGGWGSPMDAMREWIEANGEGVDG